MFRISALELTFQGRKHRVEYMPPDLLLTQADALTRNATIVVDEAAALALPVVKRLANLFPRIIFSSTLDGYEGTGRALALQFYQSIKKISEKSILELKLHQPIRYGEGDPVEQWLYSLLCLRCDPIKINHNDLPDPNNCQLFAVDRDSLFSNNLLCEQFLFQINSILVAAHYRNTPNDLQMMGDAPAHCLFVLVHCDPTNSEEGKIPSVLCVLQAALEGRFEAGEVDRAAGDMIPWTVNQLRFEAGQNFSKLSGLRIVRIATHPDLQARGFGKRALNLFLDHFLRGSSVVNDESLPKRSLFVSLADRLSYAITYPYSVASPASVDYVGVSYGLSEELFHFWSKNGFLPVYLRQTSSPLTGLNTCIMLTANEGIKETTWQESRYIFSQGVGFYKKKEIREKENKKLNKKMHSFKK